MKVQSDIILIISYKLDKHVEKVLESLTSDYRIFHVTEYGIENDLIYRINNEEASLTIRFEQELIDISSFKSVWFRRWVSNNENLEKNEWSDFIESQSKILFKAIEKYTSPQVRWLASPNNPISNNKLFQLSVARKCGLKVPDTYVGKDSEDIIKFAKNKLLVAVKSTNYFHPSIKTKNSKNEDIEIYQSPLTQTYTYDELNEVLASISVCPQIIQEYIEKKYELRVTIVGTEVFSCAIDSQSSPLGKIDWRYYDQENTKYWIEDLPKDIEQKCILLMKKLNINFGCFDFIVTPSGDYYFLEVNTNGQWLWIETRTGLKISKGIAKFLEP